MKNNINDFKPAWWLNSGHLQTIFPFIFPRKINLSPIRERLELPDGDFVDLDWVGEDKDEIVLILHGLAGSIDSFYVQGMMSALLHRSCTSVLMHFRGCSGEPNRLARSYHSGDTNDLAFVVNLITNRYPRAKISIIGYSLGGNVLLKWLGEGVEENLITTAVAVSVPFELSNVVNHIQTGLSKLYQWHLLSQLKNQILQKEHLISPSLNLTNLKSVKTFKAFDEMITAPLHGFYGADEYYRLSSCRQYLKNIAVKTLIIHALDDPFMTPESIPKAEELSEKITLELYQSGGHVGFISTSKRRPVYWLERRIPAYLDSCLS
jgi:predicted alpha/beta-fold hydrolase